MKYNQINIINKPEIDILNFDLKQYDNFWLLANQEKILSPKISLPKPIDLSVFDSIASTNIKAWELLDRGAKCPVGAIAQQQTAGKGQWGNQWISSEGGLYLSVGLDLDLEINNYPHLVIATVWGIASVLRHYELPVTIKWSNDLILNRRKLGGIKIETRNTNNKLVQAVVGVGINWCNAVGEPGINLKTFYQNSQAQKINSLEELTAITAYGIALGYKYYLAVGVDKILAKYVAIFHNLGQPVTVNNCPGEVMGVTPKGKLRVKLRSPGASTEVTLSPGQISLGYYGFR